MMKYSDFSFEWRINFRKKPGNPGFFRQRFFSAT